MTVEVMEEAKLDREGLGIEERAWRKIKGRKSAMRLTVLTFE